jgi:hypothetical protein
MSTVPVISCISDLPQMLLRVGREQKSGVLTVKVLAREIRFYLREGRLIHAEGLDLETPLLHEIASRKTLEPRQLSELKNLKNTAPQALGQSLVILNLMSQAAWEKFLHLRIGSHLAAAIEMEGATVHFVEGDLRPPPQNAMDHDLRGLLLRTLRRAGERKKLKKCLPDFQARFTRTETPPFQEESLPLKASEHQVLSAVDGKRTVADISVAAGMEPEAVSSVCLLLLQMGLIYEPREGSEEKGRPDLLELITLYLDLLGILENNFRKEIGREFEAILFHCKKDLTGQSKMLFYDIDFSRMPRKGVVDKVLERFSGLPSVAGNPLVLSSSFNKLLYLLIMRMKRILGIRMTEKTLLEMMDMLRDTKRSKEDSGLMAYLNGNLEDYLRQIKA